MWQLRMISKGRMQRRHRSRGYFKNETEHQPNSQGPLESFIHERTDESVNADVCDGSGRITANSKEILKWGYVRIAHDTPRTRTHGPKQPFRYCGVAEE